MRWIMERFKDRTAMPEDLYNKYGVMVPLIEVDGGLHILLEVRADTLRRQPGEVSFPGGMLENGESPLQAAVRETIEELMIRADNIRVLGPLDYVITPFDNFIYPYLGLLQGVEIADLTGNRSEVGRLFTIPLDYLLGCVPENHPMKVYIVPDRGFPYQLIPNGSDYRWREGKYPTYFYTYEGIVIWGITARIIKNMTDIILKQQPDKG
jgi:coenzyme A diphosphatase NUDT7